MKQTNATGVNDFYLTCLGAEGAFVRYSLLHMKRRATKSAFWLLFRNRVIMASYFVVFKSSHLLQDVDAQAKRGSAR